MSRVGLRRVGDGGAAGFTLIELLVVLGIIAVVLGMLLPGIQGGREAARRTQCLNNMKQIGLALQNYHELWRVFPPGYVSEVDAGGRDLGPGWGWAANLLPWLEQNALYRSIDFEQTVDSTYNSTASVRIGMMFCPSDLASEDAPVRDAENTVDLVVVPRGSYLGVYGTGSIGDAPGRGTGIFFRNSSIGVVDIVDGTSTTIMVGERSHRLSYATWSGRVPDGWVFKTSSFESGVPSDSFCDDGEPSWCMVLGVVGLKDGPRTPNHPRAHVDDFASRHPGGVNFLWADGSARFVRDTIAPAVYQAIATRNGDELPSEDRF